MNGIIKQKIKNFNIIIISNQLKKYQYIFFKKFTLIKKKLKLIENE